jgi:shikimate dehydrogenase
MHNAAFRALGLDAVYVAIDCASDAVAALMRALAEAGGGGNITIPHKPVAAAALERGSAAGGPACNTFWGEARILAGANTDPQGILFGLERLGVRGERWLILGTGGSARGCLAAARATGAAVAIRSRSEARARAMLEEVAESGGAITEPGACDLVINATPLGLQPADPPPISLREAPGVRAVLDLVYAPGGTPLVRAAKAMGLAAADGREVLLGQGIAGFAHWFPETDPPEDVMRAALRAALH